MKTSLTTFDTALRERLLDVVYGQWQALGIPFSSRQPSDAAEVIDPEALLWCSLEFLPTEPRLREGVVAWLAKRGDCLIRQRIKHLATVGDPRTGIWKALDKPRESRPVAPAEPCHGLDSAADVCEFCKRLPGSVPDALEHTPPGRLADGPTTILLRARDLLGGDLRHALLVFLLAHPLGGKLKTLQKWSRYSYRSISQTASRWEAADVLVIDHGFCHLTNPEPWHELLRHQAKGATIVDWHGAFDACVSLLRALAKADRKGLDSDSPVLSSYIKSTRNALFAAVLGGRRTIRSTPSYIEELLADQSQWI